MSNGHFLYVCVSSNSSSDLRWSSMSGSVGVHAYVYVSMNAHNGILYDCEIW